MNSLKDNYAKVLRNGGYAGGVKSEDDEELCTLFDSVIQAVSDSECLVKQISPRTYRGGCTTSHRGTSLSY